jgi:hypothetical protein
MRDTLNPILLTLLGVLLAPFLLSACGPQETSVESTHERAIEASVSTTPVAATSTSSPSRTLPASTPTSESAATTSPASTPTLTSFQARVLAFSVSPAAVDPGDEVVLTWETVGERAILCPSARFVLFTQDDCRLISPGGEITFTIPLEAYGFQFVYFSLTAQAEGIPDSSPWQVSVALKCRRTWFFTEEPQAGICPTEPVESAAVAQRFERGTMIWLEELGRTYVLEDALVHEQDVRKRLAVVLDPLEAVRDASSEVRPPEGLYAPAGGFGILWRGDLRDSIGYREVLGWALAPEFGYDAILQCDDALASGGRSWRTCYLEGPDGEIVVLHPLGGWHLMGER